MTPEDGSAVSRPPESAPPAGNQAILILPSVILGMLASSLLYCAMLALHFTTLTPPPDVGVLLWIAVVPFTWRIWQLGCRYLTT
jgi:hypothetical protein